MQTITRDPKLHGRFACLFLFGLLTLCLSGGPVQAQPGPLSTLEIPLTGGDLSLPRYTPVAYSYFPYYNGQPNDSLKYILGDQLIGGTATTADRFIDPTAGGAYAYRTEAGVWSGSLQKLLHDHAFVVQNRHAARTLVLSGFAADSVTYISPMPNGSFRCAATRMLRDHPIDSVGFIYSGFHQTETLRRGGDIIIDLSTRQIVRRDSTAGWIGTLHELHVGHPILVQVNNPWTFDWTYYPNRE
jgi:hypothetical protein